MRTLLTSLIAVGLLASAIAPASAHDNWRRRHHRHLEDQMGVAIMFGILTGVAKGLNNQQQQGFYDPNDYYQQQYGSGDASNCQPGSIPLFTRDGRFAGCN